MTREHASPPAVKYDLLRDGLLGALSLWIQMIDDPVSPAFPAINYMADPQRWFLIAISVFHEMRVVLVVELHFFLPSISVACLMLRRSFAFPSQSMPWSSR
jgi:hypothetical protein